MSGFMNSDGSALVGALNPSNQGQALQLDSSGNLKVTGGGGSGGNVNVAQWNAATPGISNPVITQEQLRAWLLNGQAYSATTGKQTAAGAITGGLSVFNPAASGKTLLVYSLTFIIGNNSFNQVNFTSSDPALGTAATVSNNKNGGSTSVTSCSYANTNLTVTGTSKDAIGAATNTFAQLFSNGNGYILPAGTGAVFYSNVSGANVWLCSMAWIEM